MKQIVQDTSDKIAKNIDLLDKPIKNSVTKREVELSLSARENEILHGTWQIEKMMLSYIKEGDVPGIRRLFHTLTKQQTLNAGVVAETPLRQEKNIFIGLVALIGKTAAIEGGMDIEDAYRTVDVYTQECELASTVDEVYTLRYYMVMEFTEDKNTHFLDKQYMIGDKILVAPVFDEDGYVEFYLPAGSWKDIYSDEVITLVEGRYFKQTRDYLHMPVYIKA